VCIFVLLSTPHTCIPMPQRCTTSPTPRPRRKPTVIARAEVDPIPIFRPKWPAKMASQFFSFLFFGRAHSGPHAGYGSAPIYEEIPAETTFRAFSRQKRGFSPSSMHPTFRVPAFFYYQHLAMAIVNPLRATAPHDAGADASQSARTESNTHSGPI